MAVQYHSVVDYSVRCSLVDVEAVSHFPPHLTAEESEAQGIQKFRGLAKKADRTIWFCGEWPADSGAGLGSEAGTQERSFLSQNGGHQVLLKMPTESLVFSQKPRSALEIQVKNPALGEWGGSWHTARAQRADYAEHYSRIKGGGERNF